MTPYFPAHSPTPLPRHALHTDVRCDVCVIGGGIAGILTAHLLERHGLQVVLLEANRLLSGETRGTTAKLTVQHGLFASKLLATVGQSAAYGYVQANQRAMRDFQSLIHASGVHCGLSRQRAYLYTSGDPQPVYDEARACGLLGLTTRVVNRIPAPFPVRAALELPDQAQMNPFPLLAALAAPLTVYEHTRAQALDGTNVITQNGVVYAQAVCVCTHYPAFLLPGAYFMRLHQERSYTLALRMPAGEPGVGGVLYGIGEPSLRQTGPILFFGGESHRSGENPSGGCYQRLREKATQRFPQGKEVAHWSAQDCMSADGLPYIGKLSRSKPGVYVATGFGKWGMTNAMVAARLLCDEIAGHSSPYAWIFSPQRLPGLQATGAILRQGTHAAVDLGRSLVPALRSAASLAPGEGDIVRHGLGKAAAYRDAQGDLHLISPYCAHMKCLLRFNPDECSWDCPCHGSRFTIDGQVICAPAQHDVPSRHGLHTPVPHPAPS